MKTITILLLLSAVVFAADQEESTAIRAALTGFNKAAVKGEAGSLRVFFTSTADYRDGTREFKGIDALLSFFTDRQIWSERTPPLLQQPSIRFVASSAALVDAQLVQYGSTILKSVVPVVLLLEKEGGTWKISSWRTSCG